MSIPISLSIPANLMTFPFSSSCLFSLTIISTLQVTQRTRSRRWQAQPRFAHATSLTFGGFGIQSVKLRKVARRSRKSSRSPGRNDGFVTGSPIPRALAELAAANFKSVLDILATAAVRDEAERLGEEEEERWKVS